MRVTTEGIVLKQNKIADNRRMLVLFTREYGKISAGTSMSERGKSRSALALRPFTFAEYELFRNRNSYNVNGAGVKRSFYSIGEDIDRFLTASQVIQYLDRTLEDGLPRPRIFELTIEFMDSITNAKGNYDTLLYAFIVKTLGMQGVMPELKQCVNCGKKRDDFEGLPAFSVSGGGILCEECVEQEKRDPNTLIFSPAFDIVEVLQYMIRSPLETFARVSLKEDVRRQMRNILSEYLEYHLSVDILRYDSGVQTL